MKTYARTALSVLSTLGLAATLGACASPDLKPAKQAAKQEVPVTRVVTPYDKALACLAPYTADLPVFAVGRFNDTTGKESIGDGGTGKFVTQGASDITMAAVSKAGLKQRNLLDGGIWKSIWDVSPNAMKDAMVAAAVAPGKELTGTTWGYSWVPGGGAEIGINNIGIGYRQYGIGIDKVMHRTDFRSQTVERSSELSVILTAREVKAGTFRFFGSTLVDVDAGYVQRDLTTFAEAAMQKWLTYDTIRDMVSNPEAAKCDSIIYSVEDVQMEKKPQS